MDLIISTDLGHDPDDFFAITYLIAAGVNVRALVVDPGDPDQLAIAHFIRSECSLDFPIACGKLNRMNNSSGSIHHDLLKKYRRGLAEKSDGLGEVIIKETLDKFPQAELFTIGPPRSVGKFLRENPGTKITRSVMQGGFLPYSHHNFSANIYPDMADKLMMPTFNMNGDREGTWSLLSGNIDERRFIGKNICHTVIYDRDVFKNKIGKPINRASELFVEASAMYFSKEKSKKFHDPTAAVGVLHPEVFDWVRGTPFYDMGKWGTTLSPNGDYIAANVNYNKLWEYIGEFK